MGRRLRERAVAAPGDLRGARVLVTGASGFVGGRAVEVLAQRGASVRVLVRALASARPLARFPIEVEVGDVLDRGSLGTAVAGCDVVLHCAKGNSGSARERRAVDVEGVRNVLETAAAAGVRRVVHLSTAKVYDTPSEGAYDERTPRIRRGELYAESKLAGERLALAYAREHGAPVTVIQPTVVYGPNAGVYGRDILKELATTRVPLVDGGAGTCDALYVDDLVEAMCLAATSERAPGEELLVSGPAPLTWKEFYSSFERMLGVSRTVPMSAEDAIRRWREASRRRWLVPELVRIFREDPELRRRLFETREGAVLERLAHRFLPQSFWDASDRWFEPRSEPDGPADVPLAVFRPDVVRTLATRARANIDKARTLLGYEPRVGFQSGIALTEQWARWAGLLDDHGRG